jgi:2-hydroxychromene-2-carboxylate isomerase
MARLQFWYDFASTYSYLTALRIEALAPPRAVTIDWRPFQLGPLFKQQGWDSSPFNIYPAKGRYMVRDIGRIAARRGTPFVMPARFPANGVLAARIALVGAEDGFIAPFTAAVYRAEFAAAADIADLGVLSDILTVLGRAPDPILARAGSPAIKERLRALTAEAAALGIFGAPSFVTEDGELFWGDDRLEQALAWARRG